MSNSFKIQGILDNIKQVSLSPSSLETLCEFERVIDENGLYAFLNWKEGELVEGPIISTYRVICTFSWPLEKMPDPSGASRLLQYGCKIYYKKAWLVYPVKVRSEDDFRENIKKPKLARTKVWLVTINMPKYLMKEIKQSSKEIMNKEMSTSDIGGNQQQNLSKTTPTLSNQLSPSSENIEGGF